MAFLEFGNVAGLSYRHDWDKDIDTMYRGQQMINDARKESQQMSAVIGEKIKFGQAYSDYDSEELKKFSDNTLKDISKMFRQNPNLLNSPVGWAMFNQKTDSLVNNDITRKSLKYKADKEAYEKFIRENPDAMRDPEILQMANEFENYNKYGSADGISTNRKLPTFYQPDLNFSVDKAAAELAKSIKKESRMEVIGGYDVEVKEASQASIEAAAASALMGRDGYKWKKQFAMLSDADKSLYGYDEKNPDVGLKNFIKDNIVNRVGVDYEKWGENINTWKQKQDYEQLQRLQLAKAKQKSEQSESMPFNIYQSTFLDATPGFHNVGTEVTKYISPTYTAANGKPAINVTPNSAAWINENPTVPEDKKFMQLKINGHFQFEQGPQFYKRKDGTLYSIGNAVIDISKRLENEMSKIETRDTKGDKFTTEERQKKLMDALEAKRLELQKQYGNVQVKQDPNNPGIFRIPLAVRVDVTSENSIVAATRMQKDYFGQKAATELYGSEQYKKQIAERAERDYNEYVQKTGDNISLDEFWQIYKNANR